MDHPAPHTATRDWKLELYEVIFEAETPAGKFFDVALLVLIVLSILAVVLESVESIKAQHGLLLRVAEWIFTVLFTIEYVLRLLAVKRPAVYARSFFGIIDLLAILPSYLSLIFTGSHALVVIRGLRLLRIFRIFKAARYVTEMNSLLRAVAATRAKIAVFLFVVMTLVMIMGSVMYVVEGQTNEGFSSIPRGIYWAIVTVTTVGYGDIAPETPFGQALSAVAMVLGYCMIIIPTGIFSVELAQAKQQGVTTEVCPSCLKSGHAPDAKHCKFCGDRL